MIQSPLRVGRGVVIIERDDGTCIMEYAENSKLVFASAIHETREFACFGAAINFLAMFDRLALVRWWDHPLETGLTLESS